LPRIIQKTGTPLADSVTKDPRSGEIALYNQVSFSNLKDKGYCFEIKSTIKNLPQHVLGTLISVQGLGKTNAIKNNSFFISKSSLVGDDPIVYITKNDSSKAIVAARDEKAI